MAHLDELKNTIKGLVDKAQTKEEIETLTKLNQQVEEAEKDYKTLDDKHKELLKDYKEVVKNTSFTDKPKDDVGTPPAPKSLEDSLKDFTNDPKNKSYL